MKMPLSLNSPSIFDFENLNDFLRAIIAFHSETIKGYKTKLSEALKCPPSYLSQVINDKAFLTIEQSYRLSETLTLELYEKEYLLNLSQSNKTNDVDFLNYLSKNRLNIKKKHIKLKNRLKNPEIDEDLIKWEFYSDWKYSAVCLALTIPEINSEEKLSQKLSICTTDINKILNKLIKWKMIEKTDEKFSVHKSALHLDKDSPISRSNHLIWRSKMISILLDKNENSYHFTGLHTLSKKDYERLLEHFIRSIEKANTIIKPSKEEECVVVSLDILKLTSSS